MGRGRTGRGRLRRDRQLLMRTEARVQSCQGGLVSHGARATGRFLSRT